MTELFQIVTEFKSRLENLYRTDKEIIEKTVEILNGVSDFSNAFEDAWLGGWGQSNYNCYSFGHDQRVNERYFYELLEEKNRVNLYEIEKAIVKMLGKYQELQRNIVTDLSIIRGDESFVQESNLLDKIENFKWGFMPEEYVKLRTPGQIPIYDMRVLNRGLPTPPHINVIGYIISLITQNGSMKLFYEDSTRIFRQVELRIKTGNRALVMQGGYINEILSNIFNNFHHFATQLRNRHKDRVTVDVNDEYDVQDLVHALLKVHFTDVREEEYAPSYAGSNTRMDFLLKKEEIVIEIKKTRNNLGDKEIGKELILDIAYYKNHPNCKKLFCFVYDPENKVKNPRGLENDLIKLSDDNLNIEIYIRP